MRGRVWRPQAFGPVVHVVVSEFLLQLQEVPLPCGELGRHHGGALDDRRGSEIPTQVLGRGSDLVVAIGLGEALQDILPLE